MRKVKSYLSGLMAGIQGRHTEAAEQVEHRLHARPTREDVLHGFRLILGREPGDEGAINAHMLIPSVAELRQVLLNSAEFQGKYKVMRPTIEAHPSLSMERRTIVFIHLQKTGGTSLRVMLERQFPLDRRCPVLEDKLHLLSVAELGQYDFFAGHFDRSSLRFIPRNDIKTVAIFREPRARLISFYRFLRSHPVGDEFARDHLIRLANESTAEEFFERPELRHYSAVNNHYLVAFGSSFSWFDQNRASVSREKLSQLLHDAKAQVRSLTAIGITERFEQSVSMICKSLELAPVPSIEAVHVTDKFPEMDSRFRQVDRVTMTPRLASAIEDLIAYDDELYRFAKSEFERRLVGLQDSAC
jgi:Sulfotransferase family